ncbi:MAG TPA: heavy metal translocating P-type ATPase [Methanocorpusculum sp.]|nr:heavy metal translocating P-type ATPase [Methanocorpusculum sp.]
MGIATICAFVLGEYPEAVAVMLFFRIGDLFEDISVERSRNSIASLMNLVADSAMVLRNGHEEEVSPPEVAVGETIIIRPGNRIPLDGIVLSGESTIDTASITGEALPSRVSKNDIIVSGCINISGVLTVKTTRTFENSAVSKILEMVENASAKKAKQEKFITKFARYYTPAVCIAALLTAVVPPLFFGEIWSDWLFRALIFLIVSCPCALVISIPLSYFGGIASASKQGILVKGGNYLETLSKCDTFVFDKTGTITTGNFTVTDADENALRLCAYAGYRSTHPLSVSIRKAWGKEIEGDAVSDIIEFSGKGISANVSGKEVLCGSAYFLSERKISVPTYEKMDTKSVVYAAENGKYVGAVYLDDMLKEGVASSIASLRKFGIKQTMLLSGDKEETVKRVAEKVGITEYRAELLPNEKVSAIEELFTKSSTVAYVGDGINDAPVLRRADVGISMGNFGSDIAIDSADIVLMNDNLSQLSNLMQISKKTKRIVITNIIFTLGVKVAIIFLAVFGCANMWMAVFADVGVSVIAILNSMRLLTTKGIHK